MMSSQTASLWLARLTILAVAVLFTRIGLRFITDPLQAAANSGFSLDSAIGYTNARAGMGGFPLSFAAILWFSLLSSRRLRQALALIATVAGAILTIRLYSVVQDGTLSQSVHILIPEVAILGISLAVLWMDGRRREAQQST
jgi:hypothetical protein